MASPISPLEAVEIVTKTIALYKKIRDAPEQVDKAGKRMQDVQFYLHRLQNLFKRNREQSLARLQTAETERLREIIADIETDATKVYAILERWDRNIGPFGFRLRFDSVAQAWFAANSSPEKLQALADSIKEHRQSLGYILDLMTASTVQSLHQQISNMQIPPVPTLGSNRNDESFGVLFVDPSNVGRSKVAEGYMKLLREWTVRTRGTWRVKFAHSAGMKVRNRSNCIDTLQSLEPPLAKSVAGNLFPNETAMASLFDNGLFNFTYKSEVKSTIVTSRSRSVTENIFRNYRFILVFVQRECNDLLRFKKALVAMKGQKMAPPQGQGRIVHLGAYLGKTAASTEIVDAPKAADGSQSRANWNTKTGQIKHAIKEFLKVEAEWKQPAKGTQQN